MALNAGGFKDNAGNFLIVDGCLGKLSREALAKVALRRGATNPVIGWTQGRLHIGVDSVYGSSPYHQTFDALGAWQASHPGLVKDYVIGINTLLSLI